MDARTAEFYRAAGLTPLNPVWAKLEIVLGLTAAGVGLFLGTAFAAAPPGDIGLSLWAAPLALFVLGGYLAMAGHRSHLYQSNNRLVAYLAAEIRSQHPPGDRP